MPDGRGTHKVKTLAERGEEIVDPRRYHFDPVGHLKALKAGPISPRTIAVVGNGSSAAEHPELIDEQDFVVRVNTWYKHFPGFCAGKRLDAWALWPPAWNSNILEAPAGEYEVWLTTSVRLQDMMLTEALARHKFRAVDPLTYETAWKALEADRVKHGVSANSYAAWPSSGFVALAMALALGPQEVLITGFDATVKSAPGWGDHVQDFKWADVQGHDYVAEKRLIGALSKDGSWLGAKLATKVRWEKLSNG